MAEEMKNRDVNNDVQDIDLSITRKKRFRIDGDNNRILELNTSDLSIIGRLRDAYPKLQELANKAANIKFDVDEDSDDMEDIGVVADALADIDKDMRNLIDEMFDGKVSETCAPDGTMYDLFNGRYRFEHVIDVVGGLYEANFTNEIKQLSENTAKHTAKYTKKKRR